MKIKTEKWGGYDIRFIEDNGEWWAFLGDICFALNMRMDEVEQKLDTDMLMRVEVDTADMYSSLRWQLVVNEDGLYDLLYSSNMLEARKFRRWSHTVMKKLRKRVGLEGYEVMRMTEPEIQEDIDRILDTLYWDEETGKLMQSVTVQGGDVEQVPFEE